MDLQNKSDDELAKILWDYHHVNHTLKIVDAIIVLGGHDLRVAEKGADLLLAGFAPFVIFSGYKGERTQNWPLSEAETFANVAKKLGVTDEKILIENTSTNTGENITNSKLLLEQKGLTPNSIILVAKPFMERRAFATARKIWPDIEWIVTSPAISYEDYPDNEDSKDYLINIMVVYLHSIDIYPQKGFQILQDIPAEVWDAYKELRRRGFGKELPT